MATDENNHKNEARDDWTGCTFRVERGPSSEGRAWGMADILTDVPRRVWPARPGISPRRPARDQARPRSRLTPPAQACAGHAEDHWINVVTSRAGGAFAEVRRPPAPREPTRRTARGRRAAVGGAWRRSRQGIPPPPPPRLPPTEQRRYAKMRENIGQYVDACAELGVSTGELFITADLFDDKNLKGVLKNIHCLARYCHKDVPGFKGPHMGKSNTQDGRARRATNDETNKQHAGMLRVMKGLVELSVSYTEHADAVVAQEATAAEGMAKALSWEEVMKVEAKGTAATGPAAV